MKTKVFLDTNILLDYLTARQPSFVSVCKVLQAAKNGYIEAVLTTQSIMDAYYTASKSDNLNFEAFRTAILKLCSFINVEAIDFFDLQTAMNSYKGDFEDDAQFAKADSTFCDVLLTSDKAFIKRYDGVGSIRLMTAGSFIAMAEAEFLKTGRQSQKQSGLSVGRSFSVPED